MTYDQIRLHLIRARKRQFLTIKELAVKVGYDYQTVWMWESAHRKTSLKGLIDWTGALGQEIVIQASRVPPPTE